MTQIDRPSPSTVHEPFSWGISDGAATVEAPYVNHHVSS